jgi:hypothetical protein
MNNAFEQVKKVTIEFKDGSIAKSSLFGNDALLINALREECKMYKSRLEWQPIETAPKDGTYLLLNTRYSEIVIGWFGKDLNIENYNGWLYGDGDGYSTGYYYNPINPTHWMPLPKPPTQ